MLRRRTRDFGAQLGHRGARALQLRKGGVRVVTRGTLLLGQTQNIEMDGDGKGARENKECEYVSTRHEWWGQSDTHA